MTEDVSKLKVTGIEIDEYRSGIPLQGWESVSNALDIYSTGRSRSSRTTRNDLERNAVQGGGPMGLFLVMATTGDRSSFVQGLLKEAEEGIKSRGSWEKHYDYDGQGVFHKTTVEIQRLAELKNGYLLELNAAYVGKEVEDGLAETLGVEQGLQWKRVKIDLEPHGNQFSIDFAQIIDKLQPVTCSLKQPKGRKRISGLNVASYFMSTNKYREPATDYVLGFKDGVEVNLNLGRVENRFEYSRGGIIAENWRQEGPIISGLLHKDYEDETKFIPPSFVVSIFRFSEEKYNRLPAIDPKMKTTMNDLAEKISSVFKPAVQ